ncbi:MAG: indolepyruvate oxidoreductase subunit beta [Thermotogae bacterium]|nr:indolepyruvate oxidoreductase subunit beta [Thermotogota bacterium]
MDTKTLVIAGVGGQGVMLASRIFTEALFRMGYDVKQAEVHGLSQRGGSVMTYVRWGEKVWAPITGDFGADYLVALEELEALRYLKLIKPSGTVLINRYNFVPMSVSSGLKGPDGKPYTYPENVPAIVRRNVPNTYTVDALKVAMDLKNARVMNVVVVGAASRLLGLDRGVVEGTVADRVPPKYRELNLQAFRRGWDLMDR